MERESLYYNTKYIKLNKIHLRKYVFNTVRVEITSVRFYMFIGMAYSVIY